MHFWVKPESGKTVGQDFTCQLIGSWDMFFSIVNVKYIHCESEWNSWMCVIIVDLEPMGAYGETCPDAVNLLSAQRCSAAMLEPADTLINVQTPAETCADTHTDMHRHTHTDVDMCRHTYRHRHAHTRKHADTCINMETCPETFSHTHTVQYRHRYMQTHAQTLTQKCSDTCRHAHSTV